MVKKVLLTSFIAFAAISESAFAVHCTCWTAPIGSIRKTICHGRIDPFGGDLNACHNACEARLPNLCSKSAFCGFIDDNSLNTCEKKDKILGAW